MRTAIWLASMVPDFPVADGGGTGGSNGIARNRRRDLPSRAPLGRGRIHRGGRLAGPDGAIYFSDIPDANPGKIYRFDPATKKVTVHCAESRKSNGLAFTKDGRLLAACGANDGRSGPVRDHRRGKSRSGCRPLRREGPERSQRPRCRRGGERLLQRSVLRREGTPSEPIT